MNQEGFCPHCRVNLLLNSVMRLYHFIKVLFIISLLLFSGSACFPSPQPAPQEDLSIQIEADGLTTQISVPAGSSVQTA